MKDKLLIAIVLAWSIKINAQSCDNFNKSTFQHTTNFWNWTDMSTNNWVAYYIGKSGATPINPPFKSVPSGVAQNNVEFLYPAGLPSDKIDMYPQDGWELIIRNFGINSTNPSDRVANPGFVLYNRFRAMLRFFIYASPNSSSTSNSAMMKVTMPKGSTSKIPAYFNNITSIARALDTITKQIPESSNPNLYYKWENNWLIIDMPVAYDPCVCTQPYDNSLNAHKMQYEYAEVTTTSNVGNITEKTMTADNIIKNGEYVHYDVDPNANPLISGFTETVRFFNSVLTAGNAGKKQFTGFSTQFQSAANDVFDFIKPQLREDNLPKDIVWPQAFKTLFDAVPYAGMAFGIYNFIANGGNRSVDYSKYYAGFATPREYTFTSTGTTVQGSTPYNFFTPGSQFDRATANHGEKPIYDYVLGNFQLLETPELEMQLYMDTIHGTGSIIDHVAPNAFSPRILQYRLKNPIKYAINPASELAVKSIDVSLEYSIKRNKNFFRYIDTFHTARTKALNLFKGTIEDFFHPMMGPVFVKQSNDPLYSKRLAKSGIFIANWPTKWTDTAKDVFQVNSGTPVITKGYTKEHLFNATFATQWFNPLLYKDYSFLIGDMFEPLEVDANSQSIISSLNQWKPINVAGTKGLQFRMHLSSLDVKLKVRAILRRTDADATSSTEDIIVVQTYDVKKPTMTDFDSRKNFKWYRFNSYPSLWSGNSKPGKDFWVHNLNGGNPVFPLNDYIAFPDTIWINTPFTATKDTIIFATGAIFVNAAINTTNFKVEFRSLFIDYGNNYNGNVTGTGSISDNRTGVRPGAESVLSPVNWADVLNSHCKSKAKYDPIYQKLASATPSRSKSDFLTTLTLQPNPSTSLTTLTIENPSAEKASVRVYDLIGREVYSQDMRDVSESNNKLEISTDGWNTGIYIVKVIHGEVEKSIKLEVR